MAEIKVTPQKLRTEAERLKSLNSKFDAEVQKMVSYRQQLDSMWDGEARTAFDRAFDTDKNKWDAFKRNIDDYVQKMIDTAETYETAEKNNLQTATVRK